MLINMTVKIDPDFINIILLVFFSLVVFLISADKVAAAFPTFAILIAAYSAYLTSASVKLTQITLNQIACGHPTLKDGVC